MIIVETKLCVVDNSGAKLAKCVKVIGKSSKQKASVGSIILVTLKKFTNRKKVQKSLIYIGLVVGVCY
jgi:large subunit ribosomal protein L14